MVTTPEKVRRDIVHVMQYRNERGRRYPYWFALVEDPSYPEPGDPAIRLVTLTESMPLTRDIAERMNRGPEHYHLYGRYLVVDVLDDSLPKILGGREDDMVRAVEIALALHPGPGMTTSAAVSSLSLGLPGGCMSETLILAATKRPRGWPR